MQHAIVSASALGTRCWSPARFTVGCHTCSRYETCSYPERVPNEAYDQVLENARAAKAQAETLFAEARAMAGRTIT